MAALTFKVGGDTSGLSRAVGKARGMLGGLAGAAKKLALGGVALGAVGAASAMAGLAVAARGVKGAIDLGGQMSDLASRTGIAVGELMILRQAFEDNGLAADKVGPIINKMQKGISDAGNGLQAPLRALEAMGLTMEDLEGKSPLEQFQTLQKAIASMEDTTLRTGAAMDIFGRSGGELQALFDDTGALAKAQTSVGGQAEILERNAASFDRASDLLGSMGKKLTGFFVGMADFINPVLLPVLEKLDKIDLAKYGQAAGRFIAIIAAAFKEGALVGLFKEGLVLAGKSFVNALVNGLKGVVAFLAASLPPITKGMWGKITDPNFWEGVRLVILSAAQSMAAVIADARGADETAGFMRDAAASNMSAGTTFMGVLSGDGRTVGEILGDGLAEGAAAFAEQFGQDGPLDTSGELGRMRDTFERLGKAVDMDAAARADQAAAEKAGKGPGIAAQAASMAAKAVAAPRALVTSLGRVGGASLIGGGQLNLDRERNGLLREIKENTGRQPVAVYA